MTAREIQNQLLALQKMTYNEHVNNSQRIQATALWEIALQLSLIAAQLQQANADNQQ